MEAAAFALEAHAGQTRKGSGVPYACHLLQVAGLVLEHGGAAPQAAAAFLHDVVEDCDDWDLERLEGEFGAEVASIVAELTVDKGRSWEERKRAGVDKVATMSKEAATVKAADKLHNLTSMVRDLTLTTNPSDFWSSFNGGRARTIEMARELVEALATRVHEDLARSLRATLDMLEAVDQERG